MRIFGVGNVVELAGEILPPWTVEADGRIIAYCPEEADARAIVDACNAAEQTRDGVIFDGIGPVFTVRNGGLATCEGVGVEVYRDRLSPGGHAGVEDS